VFGSIQAIWNDSIRVFGSDKNNKWNCSIFCLVLEVHDGTGQPNQNFFYSKSTSTDAKKNSFPWWLGKPPPMLARRALPHHCPLPLVVAAGPSPLVVAAGPQHLVVAAGRAPGGHRYRLYWRRRRSCGRISF
jgi:hypothetical protein